MKQVIMGNHALSFGAMISRVQVIAAYPITPQTQVVELLSELCADKRLDAEFIKVESEHSAMAACCGASAVGARTFTATSAQGLALMHEMIHWAVGGRLPVVLGNINRAMGPPWTIWTDQNDSLSQRDTGCLQFYAQSNQEVLDTVVQAFKVSEQILLPSMVILDAFALSHTSEVVDVPDQKLVDEYLPPFNPRYILDPKEPHTFGGLTGPDGYYELRYKIEEAIQDSKRLINETGKEFGELFGREYGLVEKYKLDDAEIVLIASSTIASTARVAIDELQEEGKKVGLLRVRVFRPFPSEEIRELLVNRKKVAVIDRNISFGHGGIFAQEIKSALYNCKDKPPIWGYITGIGGRDVTVEHIKEIVNDTIKSEKPEQDILWKGVKL
ncbi:MAG: pyruvate ferredoxin oxidoreductase [Candidatus Cloacimonadota bacterium]|nr:MAG: pyruvate ferredoxin oxidoreductase [Candidatus Cloacimonadota bacterium]